MPAGNNQESDEVIRIAQHEPSVTRVVLYPALWGAAAFAVCSTIDTLSRSGNWYFPVIHEALSFALSFVPLLAVNALAVAPAAWGLSRRSRHTVARVTLAFAVATLAAIAAYAGDWLGHKPTLFHRAFLFGAFVPVFVMATVTWSCVIALRDARAVTATPGAETERDR